MLNTDTKNFYDFGDYAFSGLNITPAQYNTIYDAVYGSDEFRMYAYKIRHCSRTRSHDWTECPFAHRGEKATRRDPRIVAYTAIACPAFRNGNCLRGDACEFAHGVFEYWLHPSRYRTRACNAGRLCTRKVCFFAHTPEQLRSDKKYACPFIYRPMMINGGGDGASPVIRSIGSSSGDLSTSFENLKIVEKSEEIEDLPPLDWIEDLVK
ncbi:zinc finger CCCH domain-containing protein 54 [Euphorbia lathyris]|uniref:zinc finger CCCH domain-containing protein 54 n=1 Tax=Euphorbia lathyris TaxID=212925 RepID=UPI00331373D3